MFSFGNWNWLIDALTRGTFTWGKWHFTIENVTQYNRNVNLPQVNVSRVNMAWVTARTPEMIDSWSCAWMHSWVCICVCVIIYNHKSRVLLAVKTNLACEYMHFLAWQPWVHQDQEPVTKKKEKLVASTKLNTKYSTRPMKLFRSRSLNDKLNYKPRTKLATFRELHILSVLIVTTLSSILVVPIRLTTVVLQLRARSCSTLLAREINKVIVCAKRC